MTRRFDVVIAGGGLTGAALGIALASAGMRIALVEPSPPDATTTDTASGGDAAATRPPDGRCLTLAPASRNILDVLGVWPALADSACPIRRIHVSDHGHGGFTRLDAKEAGVSALGHAVPIDALGAALWAALRASAEVSLYCPARVQQLRIEPDMAVVDLQGDDEAVQIEGAVLAIADGADSLIRDQAGIAARRMDYGRSALVSTVSTQYAHDNGAWERFFPDGPLAVLPQPGGRVATVWTLPPERAQALCECSDEVYIDALQDAFGWRLGELSAPGPRRVHRLRQVRVDDPVAHRVAVVGNAAHTLHPVAGQGFNLALRDCAALAEVIDGVQATGGDPGRLVALRRYADWRRRDTRAITLFTDGLVSLFSSRFAPLVAARDLAMVSLDLMPVLKQPLLRRTMGFGGRVPRLARGLALAGRPR